MTTKAQLQAFPCPSVANGDYDYEEGYGGMTLLDYFAGQALISGTYIYPNDFSLIAKNCYEIAKAMLAEKSRLDEEDY